jgi:uncharacterized protein YndB with AHSA1/START domain
LPGVAGGDRLTPDEEVPMTVQGTFTVTIAATPEQVWPWVVDVTKHGEYSPKAFSAELVSGETGKVGSRYRSVGWIPNDKKHANEVELVEAVPYERVVLSADDPLGTFTNTYLLRAVDGGTEVSWTMTFPPLTFPMSVAAPLLFPIVGKPDGRKRVALLKAKVEAAG